MPDRPSKDLEPRSSRAEIDAFLRQAAARPAPSGGRGRLLFALDATASREPTWNEAARIQADMFEAVGALGGLEIQLCYYRGLRELTFSPWTGDSAVLAARMREVQCRAGHTQIERVLRHAVGETRARRIASLVFVGDCAEEPLDHLAGAAGELAVHGVPAFMFQEGRDPLATRAFAEIARLTHGAHCQFDAASARELRELLCATAVYSAGGPAALEAFGNHAGRLARELRHQLGHRKPDDD
jgi:hypothetical protein